MGRCHRFADVARGGTHGPTRSQCQAALRTPVRGSRSGRNCSRAGCRPSVRPVLSSRGRSDETKCAMAWPLQVWRCSQRPPANACSKPCRHRSNSRHGAAVGRLPTTDTQSGLRPSPVRAPRHCRHKGRTSAGRTPGAWPRQTIPTMSHRRR